MGAFTGLKEASRGFSSNPIRDGKYVIRIDDSDFFNTRYGEKMKNSFTILAIEEGDHKVGEQVNATFSVGNNPEVFQQNVKAYVAGVLNVADSEVGEEELQEVLGDENPMAGMVTVVTVRTQATKNSKDEQGNPRTYASYTWQPQLDDDEIVEAMDPEDFARLFPNGL